tara:strand:- start:88 stop:630 length:543 start_codon:yes stop_codon:yes gene_type:complete
LDFGSGYEPLIILNLFSILKKKGFKPDIVCCDFYNSKQLKKLNNNLSKIKFENLEKIKTNNNFDIIIISDVLHHVGVDNNEINSIFKTLIKKTKFILLKDQFETGFFSRCILRFMDFIGNYYNNVKIPKKYFKKEDLNKKLKKLKINTFKKIERVKIYPNYFLFFSNPKLQFIYILNKYK